jgi:hypothetical protein
MSKDMNQSPPHALLYSAFETEPPLTDDERRLRVVRLCSSFLRNLAFYRAGLESEVQDILLKRGHPQFEFWREAHVNFLDICILDWCKLFADRKGEHHWRRVIDDHNGFKAGLCATLNVSLDEFDQLIEMTKHYRDKFVAHLDQARKMRPPELDLSEKSIVFLYRCVDHDGAAELLDRDFALATQKAQIVYDQPLARWRS